MLTQGFLVGRIAPRVGEARLAAVGAAMAVAMFPLAAIAPAGWMLYPTLGLLAIGTGLGIPSLMSLVAHNAPEGGVGRVMGGVQSVLSGCMIAGRRSQGRSTRPSNRRLPTGQGADWQRPASSSSHPPGEGGHSQAVDPRIGTSISTARATPLSARTFAARSWARFRISGILRYPDEKARNRGRRQGVSGRGDAERLRASPVDQPRSIGQQPRQR